MDKYERFKSTLYHRRIADLEIFINPMMDTRLEWALAVGDWAEVVREVSQGGREVSWYLLHALFHKRPGAFQRLQGLAQIPVPVQWVLRMSVRHDADMPELVITGCADAAIMSESAEMAARSIQLAFRRYVKRRNACVAIQRAWRAAIVDPTHTVCVRRLMHEYGALAYSL